MEFTGKIFFHDTGRKSGSLTILPIGFVHVDGKRYDNDWHGTSIGRIGSSTSPHTVNQYVFLCIMFHATYLTIIHIVVMVMCA